MHTVAVISAPNASIPGAIVVARGHYRDSEQWWPELRAVEVRQVEWATAPAAGCLPRVSAALAAVSERVGPTPTNTDPREGDTSVRLTIGDNYWASVRPACERLHIRPDAIVTIRPGLSAPEGYHHQQTVGRLYLLDALRDRLPIMTVALPGERPEGLPDIVTAHEVRSALREIQARPRLLDEETSAPGLDRQDVLILTIALAVDDLALHVTQKHTRNINRVHARRETYGRRRWL
jgi:hypothetical protein